MPEPDAPDGAVPRTQSGFRRAVVPVTLGLSGLAGIIWLGWMAFEGQREDVAVARAFLTHIAEGAHADAISLMTPALAVQMNVGRLQRSLGEIEPWDHIGFSSRNTQSAGESRTTRLFGVGEALSGCESVLDIRMRAGQIDAFSISPLCPLAGTDV